MKTLVAAFTIAMTIGAAAQIPGMPRTIKLFNNATGEIVGTVTYSGNRVYVRDAKGELAGTVVYDRDGGKTFYDPSGNIVSSLAVTTPEKLPPE